MSRYVIDKTALIENVHYLQKKAGVPIIGVVKGNGYGFGLTELALILEHCGITAEACPADAMAITAVNRVILDELSGKRRNLDHPNA